MKSVRCLGRTLEGEVGALIPVIDGYSAHVVVICGMIPNGEIAVVAAN